MSTIKKLNILIVCEHASNQFGGEAVLPLNYFLLLSETENTTYLLTHSRTKSSLESIPNINTENIFYIPDTRLHRYFAKLGNSAYGSLAGVLAHLLTQFYQFKLARYIVKQYHIDVVHEPAPVSPRQPSMLFALGAPVVIGPMNGGMSFPDSYAHLRTPSYLRFSKFAKTFNTVSNVFIPGKFCAKILCVANDRTALALPKYHLGNIIKLVENGVFSTKKSIVAKAEQEEVQVLYAGRLIALKAVDVLIDAVACIKVPLTLTVVGGGPERDYLEDYAKRALNGKSHIKIRFTGMVRFEEMNMYYDNADIFALASVHECGGAVVLEAMSRGLPVVATNWGGPADYIVHNETGVLVDPISRDYMVKEFAQAFEILAKSPEIRYKMGADAIARVQLHFMWTSKIQLILDIYQQAIVK